MAHGVFYNIPFHGHVNTTLSLVAELTRRGDHITYYSSEAFRPAIEQVGATFRGIDAFFSERTAVDENLARFAYTLMRATQEILPGLLADARATPPDYILFDSLCIWGKCVADTLRIPAIASISTLAWPHSLMQREIVAHLIATAPSYIQMAIAGRRESRKFNEIAGQLHETYHIPKVGLGEALRNLADLNIVYSIKELQAWPNSFDERFKFVGPLLDNRSEAPDFPYEKLGDGPVIYISLGTVFNAQRDFYRLCCDAFANFDHRVVLSIGAKTNRRDIGPIPDNFIVTPYAPQLEILGRAALFITHGGMNSVNEGVYAGVPLLAIPQGADQFLIAQRVQKLGVGKTLQRDNLSAERLRRAATAILAQPAFQQRSATLGAAQRQAGGASAAADAIASFKRAHGL